MTHTEYEQRLWRMARDVATDAFNNLMRHQWAKLYLWYKPTDGKAWGELIYASDITTNEWVKTDFRFSPGHTLDQMVAGVYNAMRRLPIIGEERAS